MNRRRWRFQWKWGRKSNSLGSIHYLNTVGTVSGISIWGYREEFSHGEQVVCDGAKTKKQRPADDADDNSPVFGPPDQYRQQC